MVVFQRLYSYLAVPENGKKWLMLTSCWFFAGADCPWAVEVDHVNGVKASAQFKYQNNDKRRS